MQHNIQPQELGTNGQAMADAVGACVHCGFCLPTCPTYRDLGEEMDSPRGRIFLMKEALEGQVPVDDVLGYIDRCLGCLACETSCPSGVRYGELVTPFRARAEERRSRGVAARMARALTLRTLPYPKRFRSAVRMGRWLRPLRRFLPRRLRAMLELLPARLPGADLLPAVCAAAGKRRARVALVTGCAQQVLAPSINAATVRVLTQNGVEVVVPQSQSCCGALSLHAGVASQARKFARRNLAAFPLDVDAIISNAAGCGSGMREYGLLFAGESDSELADRFSQLVCDVSVFLDRLGVVPPPPLSLPFRRGGDGAAALRVAYHDACHLSHAQGVRSAPQRLLAAIPNLELIVPEDWEICCGSAGIYNIEQPEIAARLGRQKAANLLATGADVVATGNIGCLTQIHSYLRDDESAPPILHTVELLDRAYSGGNGVER